MATFRARLASPQEITLVFAACVAAVYSWTMFAFLEELPAWLLFLNAWDILGIFAYGQLFALLESATALLVLILLGALLPARLLREKFVARGSILLFLTAGWAVVAQSNPRIIPTLSPGTIQVWLPLYLVSLGVVFVVVHRSRRLEELLVSLAGRLSVLLYVYGPLTLLSFIIMVLRNV